MIIRVNQVNNPIVKEDKKVVTPKVNKEKKIEEEIKIERVKEDKGNSYFTEE